MPSYNAARFIGESINSVLLQTYSHWELLIADDCSKDNSVEVARRYSDIDERIKLFPLDKNVGAAAARNVAMEHAQGQYIAFWIAMMCGTNINWRSNWLLWNDILMPLHFLIIM